jgi:1-acyl-sn-glycerol-3-phosphate acyltransferase
MSLLRTLLVVFFLLPYAILASMFGYPIARLVGSPALLHVLGRFGASTSFRLAGIRVNFEGLEHLRDHRNLVLMPNHVSNLDAAILFGLISLPFKAVVKRELFKFPFLHYCLRYAGFIEVDRRDPAQSRSAIARAVASLKAGNCFIIFPEGTRSPTGALGEFKKGAFVVAIEAKSRIVPVAITGAETLMPKGDFLIRPGRVRVRVLDPIDAGAYSYEDRDLLVDEVRDRIAASLAA